MKWIKNALVAIGIIFSSMTSAQAADKTKDLTVVKNGATKAIVIVSPVAGAWEKQAAGDLVKYIEMMTKAKPVLASTPVAISAALKTKTPLLIVGQEAIKAEPSLQKALDKVKKKNAVVQADAIVMRRIGNRVLLAGTNDESHYFAVSRLLQNWGCRWYLPTEFGECIPELKNLSVGKLDMAYAPPFEIRTYWLSWHGDGTGTPDFQRRNFMSAASVAGGGHALGGYTSDLVADGKTVFNIPFSDPKTAEHIAKKIETAYAEGKSISLAIEDGSYSSDFPSDKALTVEYDKYMMRSSMTDAMITLYNNVGKILRQKYPNSKGLIGGLAYANVTLPPKVVKIIEPNVVIWLAPIDIDPNHGMDDPLSPPRIEYRAMMETWAKLTGGKVAIYDYDQGMLVWRDMPNPSQHAFASDAKIYAKAGILGIATESRGAFATTFLNLFFRGQLMWNPDANVTAMQDEFYTKFYGPAASPMKAYWDAIFDAWKNNVSTEHEFMAAPAIYTPQLIVSLQKSLEEAEAIMKPLAAKTGRNDKLVQERMKFTRNSFDVIQNYMAMVTEAAANNDYKKAADFGALGLAARERLKAMSGLFTSTNFEGGSAWFAGEVDYMKELAGLTDGTKGTLVAQTPLNWMWKSEGPVPAGWEYKGMEGGTPKDVTLATQEPSVANGWKPLRTDIYMQGQGVQTQDGGEYTGHYYYQTSVDLNADQTAGNVHLMFPGLFNEVWLYVNGEMVAHRDWTEPWWASDYTFRWDVDLTGKLKPGKNVIAIRGWNPHHFGGIMRRPFLYRAAEVKAP